MNSQATTGNQDVSLGQSHPLGASLTQTGCNFSLYCPDARAVILCLFHHDTEETLEEFIVPGKTGDIWHIHLTDVTAGQLYGFRVERGEEDLLHSATDKLLIDPYAKQLSRSISYNERQYIGDSQFMMAKGVVVDVENCRTQKINRPSVAAHKRIIYEAHLKGMTQLKTDVPEADRGTFRGAAHQSVLDHLLSLGVTTIQFMPLASFMPEPYITGKGLTNYWGYNPVNFFAPEPRYSQENALTECIDMIDAYHDAGLEVIVDVVFNHTAEGGKDGPVLSFKGFSPFQSYLMEQTDKGDLVFSNHSGCGNTVYCAHPSMTTLIMDAMRFWVEVIGVDGFRFDLAPCLGRDPQQFSKHAGLLRAINQDPVLKRVILLAEPWDIGPGGYQVGHFPANWLECNDKFRDTVRAYWRGDQGLTADFATRLMGSRDVFPKTYRSINTSVNNVTYHDGFTLQDLVSYNERHNLANLEDNRDGHGHNLSANYGVEGETNDKNILALRERQKRNLFATLLLSQGTPHILGGDELSRTQQGNNNAYCQDNEISWYDWHIDKRKQDFLDFCRQVVKLRQSSDLLSHLLMEDDLFQLHPNVSSVHWYKPDGSDKGDADWQSAQNQAFALEIRGVANSQNDTEHWLLCFNASDRDVKINTPILSPRGGWTLELDTRYSSVCEQPKICIQHIFLQARKSIAIFSYREHPRTF